MRSTASKSHSLICRNSDLPLWSRPPVMGAHGRLDCKIESFVDSVTKEKFARAAREAGFTSSGSFLRAMIESKVSMQSSVAVTRVDLSSKNGIPK